MSAIVHIDKNDLPLLLAEMDAVRVALGVPSNYCFKHRTASDKTHQEFFAMVRRLPIRSHTRMVDKTTLGVPRGQQWGKERTMDAIVRLVMACPNHVVARQVLCIDLPRTEYGVIEELRTLLRKNLRSIDRRSFKDVSPCPDDGAGGGIVQVADMIAGELRENGGMGGPYLPRMAAQVTLV